MRLIDADAIKFPEIELINPADYDFDSGVDACKWEVESAPTIDAVHVVRCKDCEYWWQANELCTHDKHRDGNVCCHKCDADSYCSDGELRV